MNGKTSLGIRPRAWTVVLGLVVVAGAVWIDTVTGGFHEHSTQVTGVCSDLRVDARVDDSACNDRQPTAGWVYYSAGSAVPPVGGSTSGSSRQAPAGATVTRGGASPSGESAGSSSSGDDGGGFGDSGDNFS
jgi:hypothetical protein